MRFLEIFGYPISFTIIMGIFGISIASYFGKLTLLSLISFLIAVALLFIISISLIINIVRFFPNINEFVDFMAVISAITLFIIRLKLSYPSFYYLPPLIILSIFYFVILYKVLRTSRTISFKYHLLGVAITLLSVAIYSYFAFLSLIFVSIGIFMYFAVSFLLLRRVLNERLGKGGIIKLIDGASWIQMGLVALISVAISPFSKALSLFFWGLSLFFLPLVIIGNVLKLINIGISIKYHASLWSVVFPQAVFSTDTFDVIRQHIVSLPIIYDLSLSVLISAFSLFLLFLSLTIFLISTSVY
ncbi:C4-dicarboxylate ABC transporter [Acidianus sulfidivorans JP7]|uniref:C4-dicarboxylate ABC transporter n=1 Tax=Acidianus sulfidivorans JP7 TaxID=619593 RepID=A0A2U9IJL0_9CREN|nr:C4-dicarboxylate ABC transporter [Acidianus sulfidivorans]AWR96229.1 C4-dicarboxylate ABC transporter [Acidianus sulfidivorans JP7]